MYSLFRFIYFIETLAENLKEINSTQDDAACWIDLVVVLDKGCIGYALQPIFQQDFIGWMASSCSDDFAVPPLYVHLVQSEVGERALSHFFVRLMTHLTFFRKISAIDLMTLFRPDAFSGANHPGIPVHLKRQLMPS